MEQAATAIVKSLDAAQQEKALYSFDDKERKNWHFVPMVRGGLPMREMTEDQRKMVMDLLQTALSEQGREKVQGIIQLERVLQELENHPYENDRRNPLLYYLALFGEPGGADPWGWRFEGHHLSLNFSSVDRHLAITPAFMGSNPAIVRDGNYKGTEVLKSEQDLGRELVHMFTTEQAAQAILPDPAPRDIITFVQQKVELDEYSGLPYTAFTAPQRAKLEELLTVYLDNMKPEIAREHWDKLQESGMDKLYFAWMGGIEPGDPHYYRIHGPTLLVEYDNVQNGNNHIHTVWRDLTNDFGEDILRAHYEHGHKH
ncbi:hypothetical protein CRP01_06640 [Flavilitoribacter nigricans DSM 23189 = NBRC 102662]|uniref:DUF3500 domain-containing protein n=2 Tax=Flavilitoribacter TaxID=2762562 RepID=A0A2D0NG33_FLAN2|nr:hypothetical protein CRP01_06640 [Flavilitoribacter nigricans DSM 23189 = NBRC 102662]